MDERRAGRPEISYHCSPEYDKMIWVILRSYRAAGLILLFSILFSCSVRVQRRAVEAASKHYNDVLVTMNADSIAALFTPDGKLGNLARGRTAIAKELKKYDFVRMLSEKTSADTITFSGRNKAFLSGRYWQKDILLKTGDTLSLTGLLYESWVHNNGKWLIDSIDTRPLKQ